MVCYCGDIWVPITAIVYRYFKKIPNSPKIIELVRKKQHFETKTQDRLSMSNFVTEPVVQASYLAIMKKMSADGQNIKVRKI